MGRAQASILPEPLPRNEAGRWRAELRWRALQVGARAGGQTAWSWVRNVKRWEVEAAGSHGRCMRRAVPPWSVQGGLGQAGGPRGSHRAKAPSRGATWGKGSALIWGNKL